MAKRMGWLLLVCFVVCFLKGPCMAGDAGSIESGASWQVSYFTDVDCGKGDSYGVLLERNGASYAGLGDDPEAVEAFGELALK